MTSRLFGATPITVMWYILNKTQHLILFAIGMGVSRLQATSYIENLRTNLVVNKNL